MPEENKSTSKKKKITNILPSIVSLSKSRVRHRKSISTINLLGKGKIGDPDQKRRKIVLIVTLIIILLGIVLGSYFLVKKLNSSKSQGQSVAKGWISYKDERGFALQMPKNWKVNVNDWGLIKIGPNPEKTGEQTVFALTMIYPSEKTEEQVLADTKNYFEKSFSNFQIFDQKSVDKYSSTIYQIKYSGSDMTGVLNINGSGKNYYVSGFAAPRDQLKNSMPNLMKVLASFNYDAKLKNPDKINNLVKLVSWKDPREGAFTVDVPSGWNIDGGVVRPYIDAALKIVATSGDEGIQVENPYPPIYTVPNQVLAFAGFTEGSHYNPSGGISQDMIVMLEENAQNYIQTTLAKNLNLIVHRIFPLN